MGADARLADVILSASLLFVRTAGGLGGHSHRSRLASSYHAGKVGQVGLHPYVKVLVGVDVTLMDPAPFPWKLPRYLVPCIV